MTMVGSRLSWMMGSSRHLHEKLGIVVGVGPRTWLKNKLIPRISNDQQKLTGEQGKPWMRPSQQEMFRKSEHSTFP